ncbi:ATP-binding protein [Vibrio sp. JC009]|uniref:tight adherence pilus pseudopilin TadF n=1 Tax=Vibrio sp. JC009 TaxID=2912314 RepID=UPI0023B15D6E|nr:tight adherence pilus pseudopilin TadF [Vibrio sp. JC009]WED22305.1 ATP-binding protein [Vibrio sp. JC009]
MSLKSNQRGNFTVEFAILGVLFAALLVFSADIVVKLALRGKLDRLSYSMVELLKERTQLFEEDLDLSKDDARLIDKIARGSLKRTYGPFDEKKYGILIEVQTFYAEGTENFNKLQSFSFGGYQCSVKNDLTEFRDMSVVSSWGRQVPLYRVTLCYQGINWFGDLIDEDHKTVMSDAILIGR